MSIENKIEELQNEEMSEKEIIENLTDYNMSIEEAIEIMENINTTLCPEDKIEDEIQVKATETLINIVKEYHKMNTEEPYTTIRKLAEENTILKCRTDRAIEYINKRFIREGEYYLEKSMHFRNCEYGKDLLKILKGEDNG